LSIAKTSPSSEANITMPMAIETMSMRKWSMPARQGRVQIRARAMKMV
jgi:hypothetical protein